MAFIYAEKTGEQIDFHRLLFKKITNEPNNMTAQTYDPIYIQSNDGEFYYHLNPGSLKTMISQNKELFKPWKQFNSADKKYPNLSVSTFCDSLNRVTSDMTDSAKMMKYWAMYLPKRPVNGLLKARRAKKAQGERSRTLSRCEAVQITEDQVASLNSDDENKSHFIPIDLDKATVSEPIKQKDVSVVCLYKAKRSKFLLDQRKKEEEMRKSGKPVWQVANLQHNTEQQNEPKFKSVSNYLPKKIQEEKDKSLRSKSVVEISHQNFTLPPEASVLKAEKSDFRGFKTSRSTHATHTVPTPTAKSPLSTLFCNNIHSIPITERSKTFHKISNPINRSSSNESKKSTPQNNIEEKVKTELPLISKKSTPEIEILDLPIYNQGMSSFDKLNTSQKPKSSSSDKKRPETSVPMFDQEFYVSFQHAKFGRKSTKDKKRKKIIYGKENVKKFLNVSF